MSRPDARFEEAAIGILAAVAFADGVLAAAELDWWTAMRRNHPLFSGVPPQVFDPLLASAQRTLAGTPWQDALDEWAAAIPTAHAETIYAMAVELQLADGQSTHGESRVTAHLARALGLSPDRAMALFELEVHRRLGD